MSAVLLDTHALLWLAMGDARLGRRARRAADRAAQGECLYSSAVTYFEVAQLEAGGRIRLHDGVEPFLRSAEELGMAPLPVTADIALRAAEMMPGHKDLFDRLIVATALAAGAVLLTADAALLAWSGKLARQDAHA